MLDVWEDFYNDAVNHPETVDMISDLVTGFDVKNALQIIREQKEKYRNNEEEYIYNFLKEGKGHLLANLDGIDVDTTIDREFLNKGIYQYYKGFFDLAKRNNFKANWLKSIPSIKRTFKCLAKYTKTRNKNDIMMLANYLLCVNAVSTVMKQSQTHWQDIPSAKKQLNFAVNLLRNRNSEKPFYMSLHFLDPHNDISFFSYDSKDRIELDEEFSVLKDYCEKLGTNFIGNLSYYLALRYVDYCIECFCDTLKEIGLWNNTVLTILSDHGSSYSFYPLHGAHVNCFDEECYHVPVLIRKPGLKGVEIESYHNSLDVLPTLYDLMSFDKPEGVLGHSMLEESVDEKPYVMTEYMGPGCPDLLSRPIWFSIRDKNYSIGYKVGTYQDFDDGGLCEVYDLSKDPHGYNNIAKKIDIKIISYLLVHLRNRFEEIRTCSNIFVKDMCREYDTHAN